MSGAQKILRTCTATVGWLLVTTGLSDHFTSILVSRLAHRGVVRIARTDVFELIFRVRLMELRMIGAQKFLGTFCCL